MARFGTFPYSTQKYGASVNTNLLWALEIDWDDDGVFDGTNEADRMFKLRIDRGKDYYLSGDGMGFDHEQIGVAIITLDNYDGRYDPYNTSGPLYGYLEPGVKFRLWVRNGIGGTDYDVFTGIVADIQPIGRRGEVDLVLEDGWRWLQDRDVKVSLQESITADTAIGAILTAADWPWSNSLDTGPDTIDYWWTTGKKAKSEIEDLANSGLGNVFVAADGTLKYYNRQKTDDPVMILTEDVLLKDIIMPQPWEFKRNIVTVNVNPRVLQAETDIWTHNEVITLGAGKSVTLWAKYIYDGANVPAKDVVTPAATTDYTANEAADGLSGDLTGDISVAITKFADTSMITYTNGGAGTAYLTLAKLRGKPISLPNTSAIVEYGTGYATKPRSLEIDLPWQQSYNVGKSLAEVLVDFFEDQQYFPTVLIQGRPEIQFGLDLYDKVGLRLATWGIDSNFRVGKIAHRFTAGTGQNVITEIKLFPYYIPPVDSYWYLGTEGLSELGVTTYLGY